MADEQEYYIDEDGNVKVLYTESQFEPIPAGEYDLVVQDVQVKTGQDSGDPYFAFEFRTSDTDPEFDNKVVWENISPKTAWRITALLESVYGPMDLEEGDEMEFNVFDLFGATFRARVGLEEVQKGTRKGEMRNNIARFVTQGEVAEIAEAAPSKKGTRKRKTPAKKAATKKKAGARRSSKK
jgi:hypothetical protein